MRTHTILIALAALISPQSWLRGADPAANDFFESKIRPVLIKECYSCHSAAAEEKNKLRGGLFVDTREGMRSTGDSGPAVIPGKIDEGTLLKALRYDDDVQMPPKGKLPDHVIKDFEIWIQQGAPDPRTGDQPKGSPARAVSKIDIESGKKFWSIQRPRSYPAPSVKQADWPITKMDHFVLARQEHQGLKPAPQADPRMLVRRLAFDLTGLPPSLQDVEAFASNPSSEQYAQLIEKYLATPQYGERWARLWLDVARYAEDQAHIVGNNASLTYPNAYLYRDWVIEALNNDLAYDQFIRLQLAADLIEGDESPNLPALGFIGLGPKYYDRGKLFVMAEEWEDRVDVVSRGLLGLTLACARCHDHKYDPLSTEDYYGLAGVFASTRMFNRPLSDKVEKKGEESKDPKDAMHIVREGKATHLNVFVRGDVNQKGPEVRRRFPAVLSDATPLTFDSGSGRQSLAEAIVDPKNPLTARVIVNRIWAAYFGQGLVSTPSNFGTLGEKPTHPELLDDLAVRFMENGWSLKWLHREILRSATYQQTSAVAPSEKDPENRLLSHMPRRRLSVEAWRDGILATTGRIDLATIGGKSMNPMDEKETRRTIYAEVSRLELNRLLAMFDFPDPNVTAERRSETITPLQKLFVMNSPFMLAQAEALAERMHREVDDRTSAGDRKKIERMYRTLYARPASEAEIQLGLDYLNAGDDRSARWQHYAHVLLAANEMLYLD